MERSHENEQPFPGCQLGEYSREKCPSPSTNRRPSTKESYHKIARSPWWESNANDSNSIGYYHCAANPGQASGDVEGNEIVTKAVDERP